MGAHAAWMGRGQMTTHRGRRMAEAGWQPSHPPDPKLRLADLDMDGIEAEVIYGIRFVEDSIKNPEVIAATYRAYNDFIAEFCSYSPRRFIGIANIPATSAEVGERRAAADRQARARGLRGAMIDWFNGPEPIWHSMWEPMWTAAEENEVALSFHIGVGHGTTTCGPISVEQKLKGNLPRVSAATHQAVVAMQADECLVAILLCGALERHPGLKVVMAESHIGWIPYVLERLDMKYKEGHVQRSDQHATERAVQSSSLGDVSRRQGRGVVGERIRRRQFLLGLRLSPRRRYFPRLANFYSRHHGPSR